MVGGWDKNSVRINKDREGGRDRWRHNETGERDAGGGREESSNGSIETSRVEEG